MEEDTEFRDLIIKKLENNGVLMKMKAALRAQIYNLLEKENNSSTTNDDSQTSSIANNDSSSLEPYDNTTNVALSLIQDLLDCLKLDVTKSIFKAESGEQQAKGALQTRAELIETLQLSDKCDDSSQMVALNDSKVPVLVQYLAKNGVLAKLDDEVNEAFAVAASTSNSTTE